VQITVDSHGDAEVDLWAAERKVELFQKVFGRDVCFTARDVAHQKQAIGRRSRRKRNTGTASDDTPATSAAESRNGRRRR
jgi:hypothetical protein